eukprot:gb/GECH01013705.1/.p1 GENE.gb/GECH01013705.1/~~gb/GECH01013705.1/.p1  ORF type:complete len:248 (+),score=63.83 gb/GECH01013705.1/:1-744(+)
MKYFNLIVFLIFIILLRFQFSYATITFDPERVHVVDADPHTGNFIFRGNMPKTSQGQFAYDELMKVMKKRAKEEVKMKLPENIYFIDVCLLNEITEHHDMKIEQDFFSQNPNLGTFINWVIVGDLENPQISPSWLRKVQAETIAEWQIDRLHSRVPQLHEWMTQKKRADGRPVVMYVHCEAGTDRTGEVSGAYYMQYQGWNYTATIEYDDSIHHRPIRALSRHAIDWYCWYLYYTTGNPQDCDINIK